MTALAVADWPLTRRLLISRAMQVDYLETGAHFSDDAVARFPGQPFLLHNAVFNWSLAQPDALSAPDLLPLTLARLERTRSPWLSVHLGFSATEVFFDGCMQARTPPLGRAELLATIGANVRALAAALPVPVILENLDYNPTGAYEHICTPDFIAATIDATGAGMLLDLAHARVSAAALGLTIGEYLAQLPLDRVRQLHVSSPRPRDDGTLADVHEVLLEDDYRLIAELVVRCRPAVLTLEYSRDEAELLSQVGRLRALLAECSAHHLDGEASHG
jgi:uncharacterized protein (UPF0276 family)